MNMFKIIDLQINELEEQNHVIKSNTRFVETAENKLSFNQKKEVIQLYKNLNIHFYLL